MNYIMMSIPIQIAVFKTVIALPCIQTPRSFCACVRACVRVCVPVCLRSKGDGSNGDGSDGDGGDGGDDGGLS